ncbi:MAG: hypothetical protein J6T10_05585 [Methanobrevibacter sp.]|nr:hypothetical protein [Methanobrevibacter sp.]
MGEFNTYKKVGYVPGAKEAIVLIELDRYFKFFTNATLESFRRYLDAIGYDYITNDIIKKVAEVM